MVVDRGMMFVGWLRRVVLLRRIGAMVVAMVAVLWWPVVHAQAPRGEALLIGNGDYVDGRLANPVNDAEDLGATLHRLGFRVTVLKNRSTLEMRRDIREFGERLAKTKLPGLFYFAGHGVQIDGRNYVLPSGQRFESNADVQDQAIDVQNVLARMREAGNGLNFLILDACRNNPLPAASRSVDRGLARLMAPSGVLVAYATEPGATASDNPRGRNGLYTKHLIETIQIPGLTAEQVFKRVRVAVERESAGKQSPREESALVGEDFFFAQGSAPSPAAAQVAIAPPASPMPRAEPPRLTAGATSDPALQPGAQFQDCPTCPRMTIVPSGSFEFGDQSAGGAVSIAYPLAVGQFEVTFDEWDACVGDGGCVFRPGDEGWGRERRPVINVSWHDAQAYVAWLSSKTGRRYRLLSESEWEYVARAQSKGTYPWGEAPTPGYAHCSGCGSIEQNRTAKVGSFGPNAFKVYDTIGNVWEWVSDCYGPQAAVPKDGQPAVRDSCAQRVLRGGGFTTQALDARSTVRRSADASSRSRLNGFRVARTVD